MLFKDYQEELEKIHQNLAEYPSIKDIQDVIYKSDQDQNKKMEA